MKFIFHIFLADMRSTLSRYNMTALMQENKEGCGGNQTTKKAPWGNLKTFPTCDGAKKWGPAWPMRLTLYLYIYIEKTPAKARCAEWKFKNELVNRLRQKILQQVQNLPAHTRTHGWKTVWLPQFLIPPSCSPVTPLRRLSGNIYTAYHI